MKDWTNYFVKAEDFEEFKEWYRNKFGMVYVAGYTPYIKVHMNGYYVIYNHIKGDWTDFSDIKLKKEYKSALEALMAGEYIALRDYGPGECLKYDEESGQIKWCVGPNRSGSNYDLRNVCKNEEWHIAKPVPLKDAKGHSHYTDDCFIYEWSTASKKWLAFDKDGNVLSNVDTNVKVYYA